MVKTADFSRLSANWAEWATRVGLPNVSTSLSCDDCEIVFRSEDYSTHLREDNNWWVIDTVDDRGQRNNGAAKFSTFELVEKYLIWRWVGLARSDLASGRLGADLYKKGYAPGIEVSQVDAAWVKLCLIGDCAVIISGTATIFSHIMKMSVDEIEEIARETNWRRY
jgi:hypothetical protein